MSLNFTNLKKYVFAFLILVITYGGAVAQCNVNAGNDTTICQGTNFIRTASFTASNPQFAWYLSGNPNNILSSTSAINVNTTIADTFYYVIKVNKSNGGSTCPAYDTFKVIITPSPKINASNDITKCINATAGNLTSTYTPTNASLAWYLQSNSSNILSTTSTCPYSTTTAGTFNYIVRADSTNGGKTCSSFDTIKVVINPLPIATFTSDNPTGCPRKKRKVQFFPTATGNGYTYSWSFGDSNSGVKNTSTSASPTHYFVGNSGGTAQSFTVSLTVTANGCSATSTLLVSFGAFPDATLIDTINEPDFATCNGGNSLDLTVNNSSTTNSINTGYQIIWGDLSSNFNSPTFTNTTHTYPSVGYYNLTFIVSSNSGCKDSIDYRVFFGSNPGGSISSPSSTYGCTGQVFSFPFANVSGNTPGTEYIISVNDGTDTVRYTQETLPVAFTHIFDTTSCGTSPNNTFTISYLITNPCGETPGTIGGIRISKKAEPDFSILPNDTICVNNTITFTSTGDQSLIVPSSGSAACNNGKLIWELSPNSGYSLVSGNPGTFSNNQPNWQGTNTIAYNFNTVGNYNIKLIAGSGASCGYDDTTKAICVNPAPIADFDLSSTTICAGQNVNFTNNSNSPNCGNNKYIWSISYSATLGCTPSGSSFSYISGTNSSSSNPTIQFDNPGIYTISLTTISPANACSTTIQKQLTVRGKPVVTLPSFSSICNTSGSITPTNTSTCYIDASTTYAWTFTGGSPSLSSSSSPGTISYSSPGTYNIGLTVTNVCGSTLASSSVVVNPLPTISGNTVVCQSKTIQLTGSSTASGSGSWSSSNTSIATVDNTGLVTGISAGTANITFTDGNGCSQSISITVNPSVVPTFTQVSAICSGGSFTLPTTSNNNIGGTWSPAINNTTTTIYAFTPNSGVCAITTTMTVVVNQPTLPTFTQVGGICVGGNFTLPTTSNNGIAGTWSPAVNNTTTTIYTFTPTAGQCASTSTMTVAVNQPTVPTFTQVGPICSGTVFTLPTTSNNGITGTWSPAINNTTTTTYTFTPANGQCATATTTMTVTITQLPSASISYGGPYCTTLSTVQSVTQTGATGGVYSSTAGLSINPTTGGITPSSSTGGNYTVTYTLAAAGGCPAVSVTATVSIVTIPTATISYNQPFCSNNTSSELVTITGTQGGVFSSTTGLTLNATTGAIVPSTSTPGTYTVTYFIAAANGCASVTTTTPVTITQLPSASINYGGPYCTTLSTVQSVTQTGATGGVYSSTAGLSIDATTGGITPSLSTGGNYTVTYTLAAAGGCPAVPVTAPVTIVAIPTATISYNQPFCSNNTSSESVTITGTQGGAFSSTTGLILNATTGAIVPSTSTPGTYTVTYFIAAANGCASVTTTTPVTITQLPSASISYGGPYCTTLSTVQAVNQTGVAGGAYSSTTGLSINSTTGGITPSSSTGGNYTVTYTLAAAGGCPAVPVTAPVTIVAIPTATISYNQPFCSNNTSSELVTITGTQGGVFSSTTGLTLNATTGAIVPSTSTPGTYTVTYFIAAANGCASVTTTTPVTITQLPSASISYGGPYCTTLSTVQSVTQTGATGGVYSSTAGLSIEATTGGITPSLSTGGNYTVTYTLAAAGGCPAVPVTALVTIVAIPAATISYNQPFCSNNSTSESVTITGTQGGVFSSTTGLTLNTTTGAIVPSTSTPGTYTVTYFIAAANGCASVTTTTPVTITQLPSAAISYGGPYCNSVTIPQNVNQTGNNGGLYSSLPNGLSINQNTGTVTPSLSLVNNYVVTYTLVAAGGCPEVKATANLTINITPSISLQSTSVCSNSTLNWTPTNNPPIDIVPNGTTYTWTFIDNPLVNGESNQSNPTNIFSQVLENTTSNPQIVQYQLTPSIGSGVNACTGLTFTLNVTVNPIPEIPTQTKTICSEQSFSINPVTQNSPNTIVPAGTTYSWSIPTLPPDVTGAVAGNNETSIFGTLYNTGYVPQTVIYLVTPISGTNGNCSGQPFNVEITVNPLASISNNPLYQSVCNGGNSSAIVFTSLTTSGVVTYSWQQVGTTSVTGFIPSGNGNLPVMNNLVNNGISQDSVVYEVTSTSTSCAGHPAKYNIYVNPDAKANFTYPKDTACWPFDILINNTSPQSAGNIDIPNSRYDWYGTDSALNTTFIGSGYNFPRPPGYTIPDESDSAVIKMIAISYFGCKNDSAIHVFYTRPKPKALFAMSNKDSCGPLTVRFTNQTNLTDTFQYLWDFGNGQTSTLVHPNPVTYLSNPTFYDTTYYITMKAFNECDTTSFYDSVIVRANAKARFSADHTSGCSPYVVQFINSSLGNAYDYYWDFDDGSRDTTHVNDTLIHTFTTLVVDTFKVRLIAQNNCGRDTQYINIRVAPNTIVPGVTINANELFGCVAHTVNFINTTSGATSFIWDFGDQTPLQNTSVFQVFVPHTYTSAGTFPITVYMTNGCSYDTAYNSVTVYPKPAAAFTTTSPVYCLGDTVHVVNSSQNATNYTWNWDILQSTTTAGFEPSYVYTAPGIYTIELTAERLNANGIVCYDKISHPVTILSKPDSTILTNINSINCTPYTFVASAPGVTTEQVTWFIYDTSVSLNAPIVFSGSSAQYTFNNEGTYEVHMVVENAAGCKDSTKRKFTIYRKPTAGFTPLNVSTCNLDTIVNYTNTSYANFYTPIRSNFFVDGTPQVVTGTFSYHYITPATTNLPRTFNTMLVATNTVGCTDTARGYVQMNPTATASFTLNNPNDCIPFVASISENSTYATNYQWYLNGVLVSTDQNPIINITSANTNYTIKLVVSNGYACRPDIITFSFRTRVMPKAIFTVDDTLGCTGYLNVVTHNQSLNANAYVWQWGDATPDNYTTNPTHLYSNIGQYNIYLIAKDGVCQDTMSKRVYVALNPVVDFSGDNLLTCDTARVLFTNLTTNADSYLWQFSGNAIPTTSTLAEPYVLFPPSNTPYTITLNATNIAGCKAALTKVNYIKSIIPPPSDFYVNPSTIILIPNYSFGFTNLTPNSPLYQYSWSFGDNTFASTRDISSHQYSDTGSFPVMLIVLDTSTRCLDTTIKVVRIEGKPGYLYVPNAFYPNSIQPKFKSFKPLGKGLADYQLEIFDSWGTLLFKTTLLDASGIPVEGWDGTYKGKAMPQDGYAWRIKAKFRNGSQWSGMIYNQNETGTSGHTFGTVTLFR